MQTGNRLLTQIFKDMNKNVDIMIELQDKIQEGYDSIIKTVISDLLKKEPSEEELKCVEVFKFEENAEIHYLAYRNKKLGRIILDPQNMRFDPYENEEFLEDAVVNGKVTFKY